MLLPPGDADSGVVDVALTPGGAWCRVAGGALVWSGDDGLAWSRVFPEHAFEAIATDRATGELVALARQGETTLLARAQSAGSAGFTVEDLGALPAGRILALAADRAQIAVALAKGAFRREAAGWLRLEGTAGPTAMTFARGDATLLVALHSEGEEKAWLLEARAGAPALTVAELGDAGLPSAAEEGSDARVQALSWDDAAGIVWAGGGFGLVAFRPARN